MPTVREIVDRFWLDTFEKADLERAIRAAVAEEREACARIAVGLTCFDCDDMGHQDPETSEVPCSAEGRGEVCICAEKTELAHKIAAKIRARNT